MQKKNKASVKNNHMERFLNPLGLSRRESAFFISEQLAALVTRN